MKSEKEYGQDIAVVGMSCRFPGANTYGEYWDNLIVGNNSIQRIPDSRWPQMQNAGQSIPHWCGLVENVDEFDCGFFNISPREAKSMDPQQRLLLQEAWRCIENSGIPLSELQESLTGVYVGVMTGDYHQYMSDPGRAVDSYAALGNYDCILANRLSYFLNFEGPSVSVDAACASSLVSVHDACLALRSGDIKYALASGVNLCIHPWKHQAFAGSRMLSADGQCKTFDIKANGYVPGDGVGVVLLQPLEQAIADNSNILGVIKGSAVGHVGNSLSITAPRVQAQRDVIVSAYEMANISAEDISYIEAHGTGTSLGDPIEIESIRKAFSKYTDKKGFCSIGSVKTNIGHLEGAAGIAGLIKVLLMMKNRQIPKILNFDTPNPLIDFKNSPVSVVRENKPWRSKGNNKPLLSGISSFGFGGVNSHLVLESFEQESMQEFIQHSLPGDKKSSMEDSPQYFQLSAKTKKSLEKIIDRWVVEIQKSGLDSFQIGDICKNLKVGRADQDYRMGFMISDLYDLESKLASGDFNIVKAEKSQLKFVLGESVFNVSNFDFARNIPDIERFYRKAALALKSLDETPSTSEGTLPGFLKTSEYKKALQSFVASYTVGAALIALGVEPYSIDVANGNLVAGLCLAGVIDPSHAVDLLSGKIAFTSLDISFPKYSLEAWGEGQKVLSQATERYWQDLLQGILGLHLKNVTAQFSMASELYEHQYTFKKLIDEWEHECNKRGFTVDIESEESSKHNLLPDVLKVVVIQSSIAAINNKWDIDDNGTEEKFLREITALISHGVIEKGVVIEWLTETQAATVLGYEELIRKTRLIRSKLRLLDESLRGDGARELLAELASYIDVDNIKRDNQHLTENTLDIVIGNASGSVERHEVGYSERDFFDILQSLWLQGFSVNWKILYPKGSYNRLPLPCYEFDGRRYWYEKLAETQKTEVIESDDKNNSGRPYQKRSLEKSTSNVEKVSTVSKEIGSTELYIKQVVADLVEIDAQDIGPDQSLFSMGIDSITQQELIATLEQRFGKLSPTLIYEYPNVDVLCEFLGAKEGEVDNQQALDPAVDQPISGFIKERLAILLDSDVNEISEDESFFSMGIDSLLAQEFVDVLSKEYFSVTDTILYEYPNIAALSDYLSLHNERDTSSEDEHEVVVSDYSEASQINNVSDDDIAVIGMDGRFPRSQNIDEFWENLVSGRDCVESVPPYRWRHQDHSVELKGRAAGAYGKWGGFIDGVDKFDPLFFGISPKEAVQMDPQQRLFLECCWGVMEHAGYGSKTSFKGKDIGLFVGVMWNEYSLIANEEGFQKGAYCGPGSIYWAIANRVSYLLDLKGPSLAIDTACSSSLVSLHYACQSIVNGDCDMAIAGGVNLSLHPSKYIYLSQAKFLSTEGLCRSFGEGGDGYVPGEGVGAVLLKSAKKAIEDGDHIYGVVKSTTVNHGGKATGFTVPNPEAQAALVKKSIERAGVEAREIDYVECHGTGTALGDPIEIAGLTKAFLGVEEKCPMGSVKSNVGHLEAAAGIAALVKVLKSMQANVIPKSLHSSKLNNKIDFERSPFYVVQQNEVWRKAETEEKIASISSFGAGGANAHALIASFDNRRYGENHLEVERNIFILSAKSASSLKGNVDRLRKHLRREGVVQSHELVHLAYSLQYRREAFNYRVAFIARDKQELIELLGDYLEVADGKGVGAGVGESEVFFHGKSKASNSKKSVFSELSRYGEVDYLPFIAQSWVNGATVQWPKEIKGESLRHIVTPSYYFDRESYWLGAARDVSESESSGSVIQSKMEYENIRRFSQDDPCFTHHNIHGNDIMPGVVCLDIILASLSEGKRDKEYVLSDVSWMLPVTPEYGRDGVSASGSDDAPWTIEAKVDGEGAKVFCRARNGKQETSLPPISVDSVIDIEARMTQRLERSECYQRFDQLGFVYGNSFQAISYWRGNASEAIALLENPNPTVYGQIIDPGLLDGALQATLLLLDTSKKYIPFSIGKFVYKKSVGRDCYVFVTRKKTVKGAVIFDIQLIDRNGEVLVAIYDFCIKIIGENPKVEKNVSGVSYFAETWKNTVMASVGKPPTTGVVAFIDSDNLEAAIAEETGHGAICVRKGDGFRKINVHSYLVNPDNETDYVLLLNEIALSGQDISLFLFLWGASDSSGTDQGVIEDSKDGESLFYLSKACLGRKSKHKMRILNGFISNRAGSRPLKNAISGLAKTVSKENQKLDIVVVDLVSDVVENAVDEPTANDSKSLIRSLLSDAQVCQSGAEIRYVNNLRFEKELVEVEAGQESGITPSIRSAGVYLITGGLGGLGLIFARHILETYGATVVLAGRSELTESSTKILTELNRGRGVAEYARADICDKKQVADLVSMIEGKYGVINGVIHSAGITRDATLINKTIQQWRDVVSTKVWGTLNLNEYVPDADLDFFVLFSSVSALLGNPGQADYAYANRFMDGVAEWKRISQTRTKTISINWPLWKEGGMQVSPGVEKFIEKTMGVKTLENIDGISIFESSLSLPYENFLAARGKLIGAKGFLSRSEFGGNNVMDIPEKPDEITSDVGRLAIQGDLEEIVAEIVGLSRSQFDPEEELVLYGFDSVSFGQLAETINAKFNVTMTPALFYEHVNIHQIVDYLENQVQTIQVKTEIVDAGLISEKSKVSSGDVTKRIFDFLVNAVSEIVGVDRQIIEPDMDLADCGFDSVTYADLADRINQAYGMTATPALFYEFSTISHLVDHISTSEESKNALLSSEIASPEIKPPRSTSTVALQPEEASLIKASTDFTAKMDMPIKNKVHSYRSDVNSVVNRNTEEGIAIVGMDGNFPGAANINEFWENLVEGRNSIVEIPGERWDWRAWYGDSQTEGDKTKVKWGGFIQDADKFDAEFFGVSPREAELMDPQQRIMLQVAWGAFEDAGYSIEKSKSQRIGVFIGASNQDYVEVMRDAGVTIEPHSATGNALSIISNRVSYAFNFTGPSETIDTACSSSLVALNRAISSIKSGECDMALVGGVNLIFSPGTYISFDKAGMLSQDGQCKVFDERANGYVRGEGAGAVVIKALDRAVEDGDQVHSVIRSVAVNHGGRANSLTAPNPVAQGQLIYDAYQKSGIDPVSVSYIEAHGTGTALGDPIEINGLIKGFEKLQQRGGFANAEATPRIGLGALKSNIGHLETAAGIAGLIKVTLCMKKRTLVKNVNFNQLNPYIHLSDTPFYILSDTERWIGNGGKLCAGLSSFGFGGVNAHAVLEEFVDEREEVQSERENIFLFSAKQTSQLDRTIALFLAFLEGDNQRSMDAIAHTLQSGRSHHQERLAIVASNRKELLDSIDRYLRGDKADERIITKSASNSDLTSDLIDSEEGKIFQTLLMKNRKYTQLGKLWVNGVFVDWEKLHGEYTPSKISLPTYPFIKERHWLTTKEEGKRYPIHNSSQLNHSLLHKNLSGLQGICYSVIFDNKEQILRDHQVNGKGVLPGVSLIEMLRFSVENNSGDVLTGIEDMTWVRPISADEKEGYKVTVHAGEGQIRFSVCSFDLSRLYAEGYVKITKDFPMANRIPINDIKSRLDRKDPVAHYEYFETLGLTYGLSLRVMNDVYVGESEVISYLSLGRHEGSRQPLQPELLDGALQSVNSLINHSEKGTLYVPFSVERISIHGELKGECVCYATILETDQSSSSVAFDILVLDTNGSVVVAFNNMHFVPFKAPRAGKESRESIENTNSYAILEPVWS